VRFDPLRGALRYFESGAAGLCLTLDRFGPNPRR
jgi:hypothetical protein